MSYKAWFEHFKEQLQGLTESFDQNGSALSLLGYALKEQRLSSDVYLKWAMTYYKLPLLQSRFFTETSLSQEMFAKWATHYPWSEECLPVAEWDGSLIIACLQPPQDFPSNPKSVYVLATFECLQQAWKQLHLKDKAPSRKTSSDSFSFDDLKIEDTSSESLSKENSSEEISLASEENLEGLFDSPILIRLESLTPQLESSLPEAALTAIPHDDRKIVPTETELSPKFSPKEISDAKPAIPRSTGIIKPTINTVASGNLALEKIKKKNAVLLGEKIKTILSQMKTQFEKSMILTLDDQETQVVAFAWDENFQSVKDTSASIPLKTPSIFNIVSSTQKAFHGYISPNKINENFFADWNQGRIPEHVTITPILINEKLIGMLMGFGTKATYNKVSLNLAEKLSTDFVKGLQAA